ncbi:MAG: rhodanese-like domain-containing protein [Candidatus Marinimicrobia bacterium]|nr:rhodanese-like domain-containing protein [Candidatus Neomarinimicrobiota bacterium]
MIHRLAAYSLILLGIGGTIYMGVEGIYGDSYEIPFLKIESFNRQLNDSSAFILVDVRTEQEIIAAPAPWERTIHIPLLMLEERCLELTEYKNQQIMLLCPTGNRSRQGARILQLAGFNAVYLENGMLGINR